MLNRLRIAIVIVAAGFGLSPAWAGGVTAEQYEQKLKGYDPQSIEAAKFYASTFDLIGSWKKSSPQMEQGMANRIKAKNPEITEEQSKLFIKTFEDVALTEGAQALERGAVLALLDLMTKDELISLQNFYTTPTGASILKKFGAYSERLAEVRGVMKSDVLPHALDAAKAKLKESGVDVKL